MKISRLHTIAGVGLWAAAIPGYFVAGPIGSLVCFLGGFVAFLAAKVSRLDE
jgi:hypothetical protein